LGYPTGLRPLCSPLRLGIFRAYDDISGDFFRYSDLEGFQSPFLVRDNPRGTFLQRCGSRTAHLLTRQAQTDPVVTRSYVAWVTTRALAVYRFHTRRIQRWELPHVGLHAIVGTRDTLIV